MGRMVDESQLKANETHRAGVVGPWPRRISRRMRRTRGSAIDSDTACRLLCENGLKTQTTSTASNMPTAAIFSE